MQNRYVGDLGDFGKYGLLRHLCRDLKLGVVWYLVPDEGHNRDGRHVRYLNPDGAIARYYAVSPCSSESAARNVERFRACDPPLYDALAGIITDKARTVAEIRSRGVLPVNTSFHEEPLVFSPAMPVSDRRNVREDWFTDALARTAGCDVVFLDPDNGLEIKSRPIHSRLGTKYAAYDDVKRFWTRNQTLIVYQHFERTRSFIGRRRANLAAVLGVSDEMVHGLHYRRGTARVYFIVPVQHRAGLMDERISSLLGGPWGEHFRSV